MEENTTPLLIEEMYFALEKCDAIWLSSPQVPSGITLWVCSEVLLLGILFLGI